MINFAEIDSQEVESAVITAYENVAGVTLYPGDPVRLFLEAIAYTLALQNGVINTAGKQGLLAYATGGHLDEIALLLGTKRLPAAHASCFQSFMLQEKLAFDVLIPAGTQVTTSDNKGVFSTVEDLTITSGQTEGTVIVQAQEAGAGFNGLVAGQINVLVTPVAYVVQTRNTSMTVYGSDAEGDSRLRSRAHEAPESYTCAGPVGSYRYLALSAHQDIAEVAIWSPKPGTVEVRPIQKNGVMPTEEVLDVLRRALSAEDVRPLTDTVIVAAPEGVEYAIEVSFSLQKSDEALRSTLVKQVESAVEAYRLWQRTMPGRDINPTKLISLMEQAGASRVVVTSPRYLPLEPRQIAREIAVIVHYLGVEE